MLLFRILMWQVKLKVKFCPSPAITCLFYKSTRPMFYFIISATCFGVLYKPSAGKIRTFSRETGILYRFAVILQLILNFFIKLLKLLQLHRQMFVLSSGEHHTHHDDVLDLDEGLLLEPSDSLDRLAILCPTWIGSGLSCCVLDAILERHSSCNTVSLPLSQTTLDP